MTITWKTWNITRFDVDKDISITGILKHPQSCWELNEAIFKQAQVLQVQSDGPL